jgi:hypothetical protein
MTRGCVVFSGWDAAGFRAVQKRSAGRNGISVSIDGRAARVRVAASKASFRHREPCRSSRSRSGVGGRQDPRLFGEVTDEMRG